MKNDTIPPDILSRPKKKRGFLSAFLLFIAGLFLAGISLISFYVAGSCDAGTAAHHLRVGQFDVIYNCRRPLQ